MLSSNTGGFMKRFLVGAIEIGSGLGGFLMIGIEVVKFHSLPIIGGTLLGISLVFTCVRTGRWPPLIPKF